MASTITIRRTLVIGCVGHLILALVLLIGKANADDDVLKIKIDYPTREEFYYLPRYCWVKAQVGLHEREFASKHDIREAKKWKKRLGKRVFDRLHHYCAGLNRLNRYKRSLGIGVVRPAKLGKDQSFTLKRALNEFDFIKNHLREAKSPLYPQLLVNKAYTFWQLGETQKGIKLLLKAIRVKRTYPAPYLLLAAIYEQAGIFEEAKKVLVLGVKKTGGAPSLKAKLKVLQGK